MHRSAAVLAAVLLAYAPGAHADPIDLVVLLDNSGSMRGNDPQGLARIGVRRLVETSDPATRIALVTFDATPRVDLPLTRAQQISPDDLAAALAALDYRGRWTDIPGAVERALYHLQESGRPGVPQVVLLLTDGIVDTGDAARDIDRGNWLLDALVVDAQRRGIRIFGIAFSDAADFRLIQALARATGAEYRRVLAPGDLPAAFAAIHATISDAPVAAAAEPDPPPLAAPARQPMPQPAPQAAPQATAAPAAEAPGAGGTRWWPWALLAALLGAAAVAGHAVRRRRVRTGGNAYPPGAVLVDLAEATPHRRLAISGPTAVVGRVAADPGAGSIVIERETVSRRHAAILWHDGAYWLEDQQSANGTFVDDVRIDGRVQLYDGARVRFDKFEFQFRVAPDKSTLVRGREAVGDATVVRATTVFKMPVSDEDYEPEMTGPRRA